ncbi:MAG: N-methylhydantoinase [Thermoleophilaceae bacterium]|jgi:N-methylhydantoinase A|nr:N-methylhydantoinase [Thermoleophilaceae bacterium]
MDARAKAEAAAGVGFDVGGTFTDCVLVDYATGEWHLAKVPTTLDDRASGCIDGVGLLLAQDGHTAEDVKYFAHGSTVVTNTVIERTGAKTALITTRGFRDVLEIRRQVMPHRYDAHRPKPEPLVARPLRVEVDERTLADGSIERGVDAAQVTELVSRLKADGVEAIAISFLHSYANPSNERAAAEAVRESFDGFVTCSHEVLNEMREYERTSSTVANAYVARAAEGYLSRLEAGFGEIGISAPLMIFQSNGGLVPTEQARELPITGLLSGPAAGVIAACAVGARAGMRDFVALDMGGTSCDVSFVSDGEPGFALEQEVSGWPIRVPRLDIHTVGAGGGSIAWVDAGGLLTVGPQSAGASPGPACYGLGGTEATVTDAHLALGRIGADAKLGGRVTLDPEAAESAIASLGDQLGLGVSETASGILDVVNATMVRAIRVISVERGVDPRGLPLIAFGGAGPLNACDLARELRLSHVLIPPTPGVLCAVGLLVADLRVDGSVTRRIQLKELMPGTIGEAFREVEQGLEESSAVKRTARSDWTPTYSLGMRYSGQGFDIPIPIAAEELAELDLDVLAARFDEVHEERCGYSNRNEEKEIISFRVSLHAPAGVPLESLPTVAPESASDGQPATQRVYFKQTGWTECPVFQRGSLPVGWTLDGPAVIRQMDSTLVVAPDFTAEVDAATNIVLRQRTS